MRKPIIARDGTRPAIQPAILDHPQISLLGEIGNSRSSAFSTSAAGADPAGREVSLELTGDPELIRRIVFEVQGKRSGVTLACAIATRRA